MPTPVPIPVVKIACRSVSSAGGIGPGRAVHEPRVSSGFESLANGVEPPVGFTGTVVLLEVPDGGAMRPRAKMSYMLIACTSYPVRKMLKSSAGNDQSVQTTMCAICGKGLTLVIVHSVVR